MGKRDDDKAERERLIFRSFAEAAGLYSEGAQINSGNANRKEPDILFSAADGSRLSFEMVQLIYEEWPKMIRQSLLTQEFLLDALGKLPEAEAAAFHKQYANADLTVRFGPWVPFGERKVFASEVLRFLLTVPAEFQGEVQLPQKGELVHHVSSIMIYRLQDHGGVHFNPPGDGVWVGDPTVPSVKNKLGKTYVTDDPLMLLAYIDGGPGFHESVWKPRLREYIDSVAHPQFQRIYVYDLHSKRVAFEWRKDGGFVQ
jgi:hypothetical protein